MDEKRQLTVSAIQITAVDGEKAATVDKMAAWLDVAGGRGSDLVVLPELWTGLGFSEKGLPIGLQLIGKPFAEAEILQAAYAFEQVTDWNEKVPEL